MYKPKVLVLTSSYPKFPGDVNGNFVFELAIRLKNDFEIFVIAPAYKDSLPFEISDGIRIYRHRQFLIKNVELAYGIGIYENLKGNKLKYFILPFYFFFQLLLIRKLIKKEKINIVHAHWLIPNAFIAVICRKIFKVDFKIISTIHGSDFLGFNNRIGNFFKKIALNNIDLLTVVSNALKDKVSEFGYKSDIYVYSMGLDTNLFSPAKRDNSLKDKLGIKGPFLLFVGIIVEQKGIRYLIKSMPKVIEVFPDAKLVIVGEGNLKNEMIEFADKLNVSNNLHFTGILPHDELPQYFATADLFILPSFSEGWPVVVMEALSSGTPTIVTNIPVFEKHEQKKRLFTIVPVGNSEFIAKEIIKMLTKKKILLSPQNDLRTYAKENLDWVIISNKYKNIIRICIEKK